jgi:quercetin dioxygenase-like cupin family protein
MEVKSLKDAISEAKRLAEKKLAKGENADEFVEIAEADSFKIYVTAGKTLKSHTPPSLHENQRDVFMLILEGEIEFTLEDGKETIVNAGECFVLPKHSKHTCTFSRLTIVIEGVHEKGL